MFHDRRTFAGALVELAALGAAACAFVFLGLGPGFLGSLLAFAALGGLAYLYTLGSRMRQAGADELLDADSRGHVLLLRAFSRDAQEVSRPVSDLAIGKLESRSTLTFEELLVDAFAPLGPPIAIGRPGEALPPLGAGRVYVADDAWQGKVRDLATHAARILLVFDATPGVQWEVLEIGSANAPRTVLVLPPPRLGDSTAPDAWRAAWDRLRADPRGSFLPPLPEDPLVCGFVFDEARRAEPIRAAAAEAGGRVSALVSAVNRRRVAVSLAQRARRSALRFGVRALWLGLVPISVAVLAANVLLAALPALEPVPLTIAIFSVAFVVLGRELAFLPGARAADLATPRDQVGRWRALLYLPAALVLALLLRECAVESFKVPSGSMQPTFAVGDHTMVVKLGHAARIPFTETRLYSGGPPQRGEVIVFDPPEPSDGAFIKRVIGLEGDVVEFVEGRPSINGWPVPRCLVGTHTIARDDLPGEQGELYLELLGDRRYLTFYERDGAIAGTQGPYRVAPGEVWVAGDNRLSSVDSRSWGAGRGAGVGIQAIRGHAARVWLRFEAREVPRPRLAWVDVDDPEAALESPLVEAVRKCARDAPSVTTPPPPAWP
jgi:signal peptidase I